MNKLLLALVVVLGGLSLGTVMAEEKHEGKAAECKGCVAAMESMHKDGMGHCEHCNMSVLNVGEKNVAAATEALVKAGVKKDDISANKGMLTVKGALTKEETAAVKSYLVVAEHKK